MNFQNELLCVCFCSKTSTEKPQKALQDLIEHIRCLHCQSMQGTWCKIMSECLQMRKLRHK